MILRGRSIVITVVALLILATGAFFIFFRRSVQSPPQTDAAQNGTEQEGAGNRFASPASSDEPGEDFLRYRERREGVSPSSRAVSLIAVGDIMLSRDVESTSKRRGDLAYPFSDTIDFLRDSDFAFGNLETPLIEGRGIATNEMVFRSDPAYATILRDSGFSVLSLANNHTLNFGVQGLERTFDVLGGAGVAFIGAGKTTGEAYVPAILERGGLRFAFLAYNDSDVVPASSFASDERAGTAKMDIQRMVADVESAKREADFVIVSMHAGHEYTLEPSERQRDFARAAIDAGAELVIGHHPHVVQRAEVYEGKYIFYSLGNFVFDQMWSQETREGLVLKAFFDEKGVTSIDLAPVLIENFAKPRILVGNDAQRIIERLGMPTNTQQTFTWNAERETFDVSLRPVLSLALPSLSLPHRFALTKADVDTDGAHEEYLLERGTLTVTEDGSTLWTSPAEWWIDEFAVADADGDGTLDITMAAWKEGDFGGTLPFWHESNDMSIKQHMFVFTLRNGEMQSVWQSSNLDAPNCAFTFADVDADGIEELVVLEGAYGDASALCETTRLAVWSWNEWGFFKDWEAEPAMNTGLHIEHTGKTSTILLHASLKDAKSE